MCHLPFEKPKTSKSLCISVKFKVIPILYNRILEGVLPFTKIDAVGYFSMKAYALEAKVLNIFCVSPLLIRSFIGLLKNLRM
jgi:hypothetical protein